MVFTPGVLNITVQLPTPPASVIEQFVSAPVMLTVPVGVVKPLTFTETITDPPMIDGSGVWLVMRVTVS